MDSLNFWDITGFKTLVFMSVEFSEDLKTCHKVELKTADLSFCDCTGLKIVASVCICFLSSVSVINIYESDSTKCMTFLLLNH